MAHGVSEMLSHQGSPTGAKLQQQRHHQNNLRKSVGVMGSRRIFAPTFKLKVLNSYRNDADCRGNQRATARKYNIHRRQIQKWLQCEETLKTCAAAAGAVRSSASSGSPSPDSTQQQQQQHQALQQPATLNPSRARLHGDEQQQQPPPPPQQQQQQSSAAAATGFRFLPQPHHYEYPHPPLIYQAPPPAAAVQYQFAGFQPPVVHYAPAEESMMVAEIKREPASPDSPVNLHLQHHQLLKKEQLDDEVCNFSYSSGISVASTSSSPVPSHLESLPPSPRESTGSSASESEEADSSSGFQPQQPHQSIAGNATAADLARRRSFSLRFKLRVLDAFHKDPICKKNQRATARNFNINRRQVQKWLSQEEELRAASQHRGPNRQRLGSPTIPSQQQQHGDSKYLVKREPLLSPTTTASTLDGSVVNNEETPVDLRTGGIEFVYSGDMSPNSYVDTALTPPYSQPGCPFSCCSQEHPPLYYCYSPPHQPQHQPPQQLSCLQEQPLCLVKPKTEPVSSTVPTPPAPTPPKKDAILFKPYLDNPVSKPAPPSPSSSNNNNHEICNLNDVALDVSFRPQQQQPYVQQQPAYHHLEIQRARSAFVRYPTYLQ